MARIRERIIKYKGKNIVVSFISDRCTHVAACLRGAPEVFNSRRQPWVDPDAAPPDRVADVILRCPTGALHFERLDGGPEESIPDENTVILNEDGPLYLRGNIEIQSKDGDVLLQDTRIALCRCGFSRHKPFCDNFHIMNEFIDSGTISSKKSADESQELGTGKLQVALQPNGPLILTGPFTIQQADGKIGFKGTRAVLCRCGVSANKPFCDGSHSKIGFSTE